MTNGLDDLLGEAKNKGSEIWSNIKSSGKEKVIFKPCSISPLKTLSY